MDDWRVDDINVACDTQFEGRFRCEVVEGKGRVLKATRAFAQGDVLFEEPPLHIVKAEPGNEAFERICKLCETAPAAFSYKPLWYWAALCSLTEAELVQEADRSALPPPPKPLSAERQRELLCLFHEPVHSASKGVKKIVRLLGLVVSPVQVEELLQAWILNCFEHSEDPEGYSAYFVSSFISHSCRPNAVWVEGPEAVHIVRARMDIQPGDEISISYISESMLLSATAVRQRFLKGTKQFLCACERCAPANGPAFDGGDPCRGFRCPHCGRCGLFHPSPGNTGLRILSDVKCALCGRTAGAHGKSMLKAERTLRRRLKELSKASKSQSVLEVLKKREVRHLLSLVGDVDTGMIGPQHWLCKKLWSHLAEWFEKAGQGGQALRMLQLRVDYERQVFPWLSGELAWSLEAQADLLWRHFGLGARREPPPDTDAATLRRVCARRTAILEESTCIQRLMFGTENKHFLTVNKKLQKAVLHANVRNHRRKATADASSASEGAKRKRE
eukprot:TRINITY_DN61303_c0_g1_i1.p1 TRINITY_DN61303_c0_g1~~TRINITY_DN61303_c0_g1_i1.p1  ORF type:complete len:554 (-),score=85.32 TRINITY_DN61303_c0_g1_i1:75-1583(-)